MKKFNRCEVCGQGFHGEPHHIVTRGSVRDKDIYDIPENLIYLCGNHHTFGEYAVHRIGVKTFAERFGLTERFAAAKEKVRELEREKNKIGGK